MFLSAHKIKTFLADNLVQPGAECKPTTLIRVNHCGPVECSLSESKWSCLITANKYTRQGGEVLMGRF